MSKKPSTGLLAVGAVCAALGMLAAVGCSAAVASPGTVPAAAAATSATTAREPGSVHLTAYTDNDGTTDSVIVTGTIGDYGEAVYIYPNGAVDPDHDSELSLELSHGAFRLDIAALDEAFVAAFSRDFPADAATCSGSVQVTRRAPVVPGSGTGAYKDVSGGFTLTATLDEVDQTGPAQPCDGTGAFLSQVIVISGAGTVAL